MRRLLILAAVVVAALVQTGGEVRAECELPGNPGAFAFESITVSSSSIGFTAATYNPAGGHAIGALVTVEADEISFRFDGGTPTAAAGHKAASGATVPICGVDNVKNFRAIRVTTDATLRVSYYR